MNHVHEYHVFIIICLIFLKGIPLVRILCNIRVYILSNSINITYTRFQLSVYSEPHINMKNFYKEKNTRGNSQ